MGQLSSRLAHLLRGWGSDPSVHQPELQALAHQEALDPPAALEVFHRLKRMYAVARRRELALRLKRPFVSEGPEDDEGLSQREIERDIRWLEAASLHARRIDEANDEFEAAWSALSSRRFPHPGPLTPRPWRQLADVAEEAESYRRAAMREARVERRYAEVVRRCAALRHLRVPVPELLADAAAANAALDHAASALDEAEAIENAHRMATLPLRDAAVREYRARSRKHLLATADALLAEQDTSAALAKLAAVLAEAERLRADAAADAEKAVRARRSGRAPPARERSAADGIDPYG